MNVTVNGLRQVAQRVEDLDRAITFYGEVVGLNLVARFDPPGIAFFDLGGVRLLLESGAPSCLLYLHVDDVRSETERLRDAGVHIESEPHIIFADPSGQFGLPGEGEEMSFFRDTEGNLVALAGRRTI
jgi:methylmalonyl-CoA/ethylmalonyl-CoA epimerase